MTVISNLMEWLKNRGVQGHFTKLDVGRAAIRYMDDCEFFKEYCGQPLRSAAEVRTTTIPFRKVLCEECHGWLDLTVFPWLANRLNTNTASLSEFKTCVREIVQNIKDHSTEEIGCIHIQHFPSNNTVEISVSDFGIGIPAELGRAFTCNNDAEALALAVQEGISS